MPDDLPYRHETPCSDIRILFFLNSQINIARVVNLYWPL